jgi:hypothetical protein
VRRRLLLPLAELPDFADFVDLGLQWRKKEGLKWTFVKQVLLELIRVRVRPEEEEDIRSSRPHRARSATASVSVRTEEGERRRSMGRLG